MDNITAADAIGLMPSEKVKSFIKEIDDSIKKVAEADKSSLRLGYNHLGNYKFAFSNGLTIKDIEKHYMERGFTVTEYYEERQFVDAGVEISWKTQQEAK